MLLGTSKASVLSTSLGSLALDVAVQALLYAAQPEAKPCPNAPSVMWDTSSPSHDSVFLCPVEYKLPRFLLLKGSVAIQNLRKT